MVSRRRDGGLRKGDRGRGAGGKLKASARAWAFAQVGRVDDSRPVSVDAEDVAAFAALGVTVEPTAGRATADVEVWADNWPAVTTFLDLSTSWRRLAVFGAGLLWEGLDYTAADVLLRRRGLEGDEVFAALRIMEQEALPILNEAVT